MAKKRITRTTTVNTTTATPGNSNITLPTDVVWDVLVTIVARGTAGAERATYRRRALVYRASGTAAQQGTTQTIGTDIETSAGLDVSVQVAGNDVQATVTGLAATTIDWTIVWEITEAP